MPYPTCAIDGALANLVFQAPGNDSGMSSQLSKEDTDNTPAHVIYQSSSRRAPRLWLGTSVRASIRKNHMQQKRKTSAGARAKQPSLKPSPKPRLGANGQVEPVIDYMDHAPVHPLYVMTDGLFRPIQHGTRAAGIQAANFAIRNGDSAIRVDCAWKSEQVLDITDQLVLYHLCQLAATPGEHRRIVDKKRDPDEYAVALSVIKNQCVKASNSIPHSLEDSLTPSTLVAVFATIPALARGIGMTATGPNTQVVTNSLRRLAKTSCEVTLYHPGVSGPLGTFSYRLLTAIRLEEGPILAQVTLNPELSAGCVSRIGVNWINMREQRMLQSKPARRLHAWFSAWAFSGEVRKIKLETLLSHVWGTEECTASAKKSRIRTLKEAVQAIGALPGWVCWFNDADRMVRVRKPRFVGSPDEDVVTPTADVVTEAPSVATDTMGVVTEPDHKAEPNAGAASEAFEALI
ncbi:MAG: hypothetical protein C0449_11180 [Polaromonas sp.]|nr:hypothetical protein [Polaromonas sp.]